MIIDGKKIAEKILENLKSEPKPERFLAAFTVAPDDATKKFLERKKKIAKELDVDFRLYEFSESIKQDDFRKEIEKIVLGGTCGGAILQLPLPAHINPQYVLNAVPRDKDVDVLGERSLGAFFTGRNSVLPPAVGVVLEILKTLNLELSTLNCAVVGLGRLVGKPIAAYLEGKAKNIFLLDKGSDFSTLKNADVVVCGAGDPGIIKTEMLKENSVVIDFGYGAKNGKTMGDFDSSQLEANEAKSYKLIYTPTPGGTGPILVAKLFENFFSLIYVQKPLKKKPSFFKG